VPKFGEMCYHINNYLPVGATFEVLLYTIDARFMNFRKPITAVTLAILAAAMSCDDGDPDKSQMARLGATLETDTWRITYFFDTQDETHHFANYIFTFNDDGTVAAARGTEAANGTWIVSSSSNGNAKLTLDFGVTAPFDELNDDWDVIQLNNDLVQLQDVSGGSGETDLLTFSKI
jgi:hypothetical protein